MRDRTAALTRNQNLVYAVLAQSEAPMSAYSILDRLRGEGFRAPLQVYRALEKLIGCGLVHRLETLSAFVACCQPDCGRHGSIVFLICEECARVTEIVDTQLDGQISKIARTSEFSLKQCTVELLGRCKACAPR